MAPPGLYDVSAIRAHLDGVTKSAISGHMVVCQGHHSSTLTLLEVRRLGEPKTMLLAIASDQSLNGRHVEADLCEWVSLSSDESDNETETETRARWFSLLGLEELPLEGVHASLEADSRAAEIFGFGRRLSLCLCLLMSRTLPLTVLADSLAYAPTGADLATAAQVLPGCCFLALTGTGGFLTRRLTARAVMATALPQLDALSAALLPDLTLVSRLAVSGSVRNAVSEDSPQAVVQSLREQTGQSLHALSLWAALSRRPFEPVSVSSELMSLAAHTISSETAQLLSLERREATLDGLWTFLLGRAALRETKEKETDAEVETVVNALARPVSVSSRFGEPPQAGETAVNEELVACRLLLSLPLLSDLSTRLGHRFGDTERISSLKRTVARCLQPFSSQPLFKVDAGFASKTLTFGRAPENNPSTKKRSVPRVHEMDQETDTETETCMRKRRLSSTDKDCRARKFARGFASSSEGSSVDILGSFTGIPDVKISIRFSVADLELGETQTKALIQVINKYEAFIQTSASSELKSRITEDVPKLVGFYA